MKFIELLAERINRDVNVQALTRLIMILVIVWLLRATDVVWMSFLQKGWHIIRPFFLGFIIAYVLQPLIRKLEGYKISRKLIIPVVYILLLVIIGWLVFTIIPLLYSRLSSFLLSLINGVNSAYSAYVNFADSDVPLWIQRLISETINTLRTTMSLVPQLSSVSTVLTDAANVFTITILTLIISMYMCSSWEKIKESIYAIARRFGNPMIRNIQAVDREIGGYIRSLLVLMAVKFVEYSIMYYLVGHKDWVLVALLTAIGLIVPYIGPMIGNAVGILTALSLPTRNIVILLICIVALSQVDAYIIEPLIHSRNVKISPIWALFSIYAGGILAGGWGVMLGIPTYLAVRTIVRLNRQEV